MGKKLLWANQRRRENVKIGKTEKVMRLAQPRLKKSKTGGGWGG
jgi:hypothetical protein